MPQKSPPVGRNLSSSARLPPHLVAEPKHKHLIIFVLPWPQGAPTAPELIPQSDPSLPVAIADLKASLLRLRNAETLVPHPAFGKLSRFSWGALIHKHLDHHLKQFGV